MKLLYKGKDGGPKSNVTGYWLIEWKNVFSIVLLKFHKGRRESFHSHAFNAFTWFLSGELVEERMSTPGNTVFKQYSRSLLPKYTARDNIHRVSAIKDSWCLSIRGPWNNTWQEYDGNKFITLTHGRKIVGG